jgi:hypothetical protein
MQLELFPDLATRQHAERPAWLAWFLLGAVVLLFLWACWATGQLLSRREPTIVTVDLARVMSDYIRAESADELPPAQATLRAALFARLAEDGVAALGSDGALVLVSQAVVGKSARDVTPDLVRYIEQRMPPRPASAGTSVEQLPPQDPALASELEP